MGFATLPNQVHRKTVKKGFTFTVMVAGESFLMSTNWDNWMYNFSPKREILHDKSHHYIQTLRKFQLT